MEGRKRKTTRKNTAVISIETDNEQPVQYIVSEEVEEDSTEEDGIIKEENETVEQSSYNENSKYFLDVGEDMEEEEEEDDEVEVEHVCGKCNATFDQISGLKKHLIKCRQKKPFESADEDDDESDETTKALNKKGEFLKELNAKNKYPKKRKNLCFCCDEEKSNCHTGTIPCTQCSFIFHTYLGLEKHVFSLHSASTEYQCPNCLASCPSSGILDLHMQASHTTVKPFSCSKCSRSFTRKYHLERHLQHTDCDESVKKVMHACDVCEKKFSRLDNLREHLRGHMGQPARTRDYQCPYCEKMFFGSSMLNIHIRTHTGEKPFPCDLCDKCFSSTGALRKHRRIHTGEKPYQCSVCETSFTAKETLNRHFKTHTGDKPHKCNLCGKSFIQATQLRSHMFYHTGENAYPCTICGKEFNRPLRLKEHIKYVHNRDKYPLVCNICSKVFTSPADLNRHMSIHDQVKEFHCNVCEKEFGTKASLIGHLRTHTSEEPSICDLCQKRFIRLDCLVRHVKKTHQDALFKIIEEAQQKKLQFIKEAEAEEIKEKRKKLRKINETNETDDDEDYDEMQLDDDDNDLTDGEIIDKDEEILGDEDSKLMLMNIEKKENAAEESDEDNIVFMDDETLKRSITDLLNFLVDEETLISFGWPETSVEEVLSAVIRHCGHTPADYTDCSDYTTKMRENTKLLFTVVIDDDSIKTLLNNHTIDEVILRVLKMTKSAD